MKNTCRLFDRVRWFMESRADIEAGYTRTLENAEKYKGSAAYEDLKRQADTERAEALDEEKKAAVKAFREIFPSMRENARARKVTPPSTEQVNLLTVLQMRGDTLSALELRDAANNMAGCPAALAVLSDLARSRGLVVGFKNDALTTETVLKYVDSLERNSYALLNGSAGIIQSRIPASEADCLTRLGGMGYLIDNDGVNRGRINEALVSSFSAIVNGEEAGA